ncbi:hypothetical protein CLIB1444_23S00848 [[Candida] jaroonii]|uniref:Uncharacterized protein n=1 Tax=[Candida] jaroonii TaxID=467808 RepID=A0ACA9YFS1_9ASCO|nr:hypothetical protein CLIB1444_23S00848 [[Candida] jaroonii]
MNADIPKFISTNPWYKNGETELKKDHSDTQSKGFEKGYDSKRDQYDGFEVQYKEQEREVEKDDDDTDFEMERQELGIKIDVKKLKKLLK